MAIGGATRDAKAKKGHALTRAPSPPIRYELWPFESTLKTPTSEKFKRKADRQQKASISSRFANFGRLRTGGNKGFGSDDEDDNADDNPDDNISLISMTGLIADDVCQLQNLCFENIGPDIRQHNNESKKTVPVIRPFAGYGTPETQSMNSDEEVPPPSSQQMEVKVIDEDSDNISEITPTGCAGFEVGRAERRRRNKRNNITTYESNNRATGCYGNEIKSTRSPNPDDSFHGMLVSMVTCVPSPDYVRDIRRSFSDEQIGTGTTSTDSRGIFLDDNTEHENRRTTRSVDGSYSKNNSTYYGNHCKSRFGNRGPVPSSIVSAPATSAVFKNSSDRYNQLVVGPMNTNLNGERTPSNDERQHRKYTPSWFKSKRRNHPTERLTSPTRVDGTKRNANVEVVFKQAGTQKDVRRPATTTEGLSPHCKQSRLKQLLTRGRSKERKRQQQQQEEREATAVPTVRITETDQDQHKQHRPKSTKTCKGGDCSGPSMSSSEILPIVLCNADTALMIAAEAASLVAGDLPGDRRVTSRRAITRRTRSKERVSPPLGHFATKTYVPPSAQNHGPVWRGAQDPDFQSRWPNTEPEVFASVPPETNNKSNPFRKNRMRCSHRNLDAVDLDDDESYPTTKWTQSRSYDEDNCEHGDIHVLSIVGHHLSEHHRKDGSTHPIAAGSPFSARHQHNLAQQPLRNLPPFNRISSSSHSTNSNASTSASASSSSSSSSTPFSRRRLGDRSENLRIVGKSNEASKFAADNAASAKVKSPWRNDYESHMASKSDGTGTSPHRLIKPPKIKRTLDSHTCFNEESNQNSKVSLRVEGIPRQRRMLV